jgi:hypothetical protein
MNPYATSSTLRLFSLWLFSSLISEEEYMAEEQEKNDDLNQEPVFYYSRERRLERASQAVRDLNNLPPPKPQGLIRTLTANKPGTILFATIVIMSVFIVIMFQVQGGRNGTNLGENGVTLSARSLEGKTYLIIKKTAQGERYYTGPVDLAISVPQKHIKEGTAPIENRQIFFTLEEKEEFPLALPFEGPELLVVMRAGERLAVFQCRVGR